MLFPTVEVGVPIETNKDALRRRMRAQRMALDAVEVATRSARVCAHLLAHAEVTGARVIAAYAPVRNEVDPGAALETLAARGAVIAYPRITSSRPPRLTFHPASRAELRASGRLGIPEPEPWTPPVDPRDIDVILVPCLAVDRSGCRLGQGGGHYDALAGVTPRARRIALAYAFQLVERCPTGARDRTVDLVVTEDGPLLPAPSPGGPHGQAL